MVSAEVLPISLPGVSFQSRCAPAIPGVKLGSCGDERLCSSGDRGLGCFSKASELCRSPAAACVGCRGDRHQRHSESAVSTLARPSRSLQTPKKTCSKMVSGQRR